jgi:hypothetical protein
MNKKHNKSKTVDSLTAMTKYSDLALTEEEVIKIRSMQSESKEAVDNTESIRKLVFHSRLQADLTKLRRDILAFRDHPVSCPRPDPVSYVTLEKLIPSNPDPRHLWDKMILGNLDLDMLELMILKYSEIEKGEKDHVYMNGLIGTILAKEFIQPTVETRTGKSKTQKETNNETISAIKVPDAFVTIPTTHEETSKTETKTETVHVDTNDGLSAYEKWRISSSNPFLNDLQKNTVASISKTRK